MPEQANQKENKIQSPRLTEEEIRNNLLYNLFVVPQIVNGTLIKNYMQDKGVYNISELPSPSQARAKSGNTENVGNEYRKTPESSENINPFLEVVKISNEITEATKTELFNAFNSRDTGRFVIDRDNLDVSLSETINKILPTLLIQDPELKDKIKNSPQPVKFLLIGTDGSIQIGKRPGDPLSKLRETVSTTTFVTVDDQQIQVEGVLEIFDHHPEDVLLKEKVDSAQMQVHKYVSSPEILNPVLEAANNPNHTPPIDKPLTIVVNTMEKIFAMDVDAVGSVAWINLLLTEPQILDPNTHEGQIGNIISEIINFVDKRGGAPMWPVEGSEGSKKPDRWMETVKLLYTQWLAMWPAYYYTLNKRSLGDKIPSQIESRSRANLIAFIKYLSKKITPQMLKDAKAREVEQSDPTVSIQLLLDTAFQGEPSNWITNPDMQEYLKSLEEIYQPITGSEFSIEDIKSGLERQVLEAQNMPAIFEENFKVAPLKINDKVYRIAIQENDVPDTAAGRAYIAEKSGGNCDLYFRVRNQDNTLYASFSVLGEITPELVKLKEILDYFTGILFSARSDVQLKLNDPNSEYPLMKFVNGGLVGGTREAGGLPFDSIKDANIFFTYLIKSINFVVHNRGGNLDNLNKYQIVKLIVDKMRTITSPKQTNEKVRLFLLKNALLFDNNLDNE